MSLAGCRWVGTVNVADDDDVSVTPSIIVSQHVAHQTAIIIIIIAVVTSAQRRVAGGTWMCHRWERKYLSCDRWQSVVGGGLPIKSKLFDCIGQSYTQRKTQTRKFSYAAGQMWIIWWLLRSAPSWTSRLFRRWSVPPTGDLPVDHCENFIRVVDCKFCCISRRFDNERRSSQMSNQMRP